jgi:arginine repressor
MAPRPHQPAREARRDAIREILGGGTGADPVNSQAELRRRLRARGFKASQATLSRDMAVIGAQRAAGTDGPRYLVDGDGGALPLEPVRRLVDGVEHSDTLVVVRTKASTTRRTSTRCSAPSPATTRSSWPRAAPAKATAWRAGSAPSSASADRVRHERQRNHARESCLGDGRG